MTENLALGAAFNSHDIFRLFRNDKLKTKLTSDQHDTLCSKVLRECLNLIFEDCIENNVTFELPGLKERGRIHVHRTDGEDFKKARQNGKWKEIDITASNFSGYQLSLVMKTAKRLRVKPIYISGKLRQKLIDYTNQGKQYC